MNERRLSQLQKEYRVFFLEKMNLYGVKSPAELSKERKSMFFSEVKKDWTKIKNAKKKRKVPRKEEELKTVSERKPVHKQQFEEKGAEYLKEKTKHRNQDSTQNNPQPLTKQIIKSVPNDEQTSDLKILFSPNDHFKQDENYEYPVVKMPKINSNLKLPRNGRTNQKGFTEDAFYSKIKKQIPDIETTNNVHMVIPNFNKPYEPDIVLFDRELNLYIDIEIDEPYDGYYRFPTHCIKLEEELKQDDIRDLFFIESGWIVIRFTEKQIHLQTDECIKYIKNVLFSLYDKAFENKPECKKEEQWDENQCIQWEKNHYREKYLGISRFRKQYNFKEIEIDSNEVESIEQEINRTEILNPTWNVELGFDEEKHVYSKDKTGNAKYISVTTLIGRFFPFDLKRYVERKALDEGRTEEDVFMEYLMIRDEAAEKGTYLHNQIENFLKGESFDKESIEFTFFLDFFEKEIKSRNLSFYEAEKMIYSEEYNIAGTIDCLFKKEIKNEYVMIDWKRSKKLTIDGRPKKYGFGFALSELNHLDNSSYYRYCLQQNIYKAIAEKNYGLKISSMRLVVLHENFDRYCIVSVPNMERDTKIILNSLNHKI